MSLLVALFVLAGAFPIGILLKKTTKEEIKPGRFYFQSIWFFSVILGLISYFLVEDYNLKMSLVFWFGFVFIVSFISWKN